MKVALALVLVAVTAPAADAAHFRNTISGKTLRVWGYNAKTGCSALPAGRFTWRIQIGKKVRRVTYRSACAAQGTTIRFAHFRVLVGQRTAETTAPVSHLELIRLRHAKSGTRIKLTALIDGKRIFDRPYSATGNSLRMGWPQPATGGGGGDGGNFPGAGSGDTVSGGGNDCAGDC